MNEPSEPSPPRPRGIWISGWFGLITGFILCVLVSFIWLLVTGGVLLSQPPKKLYTSTQWVLGAVQSGAVRYRLEHGVWPVDDGDSTFMYKLMGGGVRPPMVRYFERKNVYLTVRELGLASPTRSPWGKQLHGFDPNPPFYNPTPRIAYPPQYNNIDSDVDNWASVPKDAEICPWLATDVIGHDHFGGLIRYRTSGDFWRAYSDGANLRDNGGWWDDIQPGYDLTFGMIAAYHLDILMQWIIGLAIVWGCYCASFLGWRSRVREAKRLAASAWHR